MQALIVACLKKNSEQVIIYSACSQWNSWICFFYNWFNFTKTLFLRQEKDKNTTVTLGKTYLSP